MAKKVVRPIGDQPAHPCRRRAPGQRRRIPKPRPHQGVEEWGPKHWFFPREDPE